MKLFELTKYFGKRGKYVEPKKEDIDAIKELVGLLCLEQSPSTMNNIKISAKKLKLEMIELEDKKNNYAFYNKNVGPIFFVWNFNKMTQVENLSKTDIDNYVENNSENDDSENDSKNDLENNTEESTEDQKDVVKNVDPSASPSCLVYVHSGSDNIDNFVLNQFLSNVHKCLVINGWSISSTTKKSLTQASRTKCNADHSYDNLMNYFVNFINLQIPSLVMINCHGMQTSPEKDMWIINSMSGYNYSIRNYPVLLLIAFLLHSSGIKVQTNIKLNRFTLGGKPIKLLGFDKSGPTTSTIGKIIHSGSMNPKDALKDTGNYVHIEHGISFFKSIKNSNTIANVHKIALSYYTAWNPKIFLENAPVELEKFEQWLFSKN